MLDASQGHSHALLFLPWRPSDHALQPHPALTNKHQHETKLSREWSSLLIRDGWMHSSITRCSHTGFYDTLFWIIYKVTAVVFKRMWWYEDWRDLELLALSPSSPGTPGDPAGPGRPTGPCTPSRPAGPIGPFSPLTGEQEQRWESIVDGLMSLLSYSECRVKCTTAHWMKISRILTGTPFSPAGPGGPWGPGLPGGPTGPAVPACPLSPGDP